MTFRARQPPRKAIGIGTRFDESLPAVLSNNHAYHREVIKIMVMVMTVMRTLRLLRSHVTRLLLPCQNGKQVEETDLDIKRRSSQDALSKSPSWPKSAPRQSLLQIRIAAGPRLDLLQPCRSSLHGVCRVSDSPTSPFFDVWTTSGQIAS